MSVLGRCDVVVSLCVCVFVCVGCFPCDIPSVVFPSLSQDLQWFRVQGLGLVCFSMYEMYVYAFLLVRAESLQDAL